MTFLPRSVAYMILFPSVSLCKFHWLQCCPLGSLKTVLSKVEAHRKLWLFWHEQYQVFYESRLMFLQLYKNLWEYSHPFTLIFVRPTATSSYKLDHHLCLYIFRTPSKSFSKTYHRSFYFHRPEAEGWLSTSWTASEPRYFQRTNWADCNCNFCWLCFRTYPHSCWSDSSNQYRINCSRFLPHRVCHNW